MEIELTSSRRSGPYRNQRFYRQRYPAAAKRFVARLRQRIEVLRISGSGTSYSKKDPIFAPSSNVR